MSFDVGADAYAQFMGRYSEQLAADFASFAGVQDGQRALDVGCGPGALTAQLVTRLGVESVVAVDPSEQFVAAAHQRIPELEVRRASAEDLPFVAERFDCALAQLVVHFMTDPVAGLREMARVTRAGGVVAACVWDHAGGTAPLAAFWRAVREVDPAAHDESGLAGAREGHLAQLLDQAGLRDIETGVLSVRADYATFEDWWHPFTLGVGPAGAYVAGLDEAHRDELRAHCATLLPATDIEIAASAWTACGRV